MNIFKYSTVIIIFTQEEIRGLNLMRIRKDGRPWGQNNSYHKPEYIKKQREAHLGPKNPNRKDGVSSLENKRKYKSKKYYLHSKKNLEKLKRIGQRNKNGTNNPNFGRHHLEETKRIMREKKKYIYLGSSNPNWQGGISFLPYSPDFNDKLKEEIRKRDNFECQSCFLPQCELVDNNGKQYKLIVHHLDSNKNNNDRDNLISLCRNCYLDTHYGRVIFFPLTNKSTGVLLR